MREQCGNRWRQLGYDRHLWAQAFERDAVNVTVGTTAYDYGFGPDDPANRVTLDGAGG